MNDLLYLYQHLPGSVSPIVFEIGIFSLKWYPFMYLVAFGIIFLLLKWRFKKGEMDDSLASSREGKLELIFVFMAWAVVGTLLGGRLGYVLFYDLSYFLNNPLEIISPFDGEGNLIGIYGMSYHGGVLGILLATLIFVRLKKINFIKLADFVVPAIPAGYFFGRIGNFMNGELYGRITEKSWGMFFDSQVFLRHPSQLYEAFLEGILLFAIMWKIRNNSVIKGNLLLIYLAGYSILRFIVEFWREPDEQIGLIFGDFTLGQLLSLGVIVASILAFKWRAK